MCLKVHTVVCQGCLGVGPAAGSQVFQPFMSPLQFIQCPRHASRQSLGTRKYFPNKHSIIDVREASPHGRSSSCCILVVCAFCVCVCVCLNHPGVWMQGGTPIAIFHAKANTISLEAKPFRQHITLVKLLAHGRGSPTQRGFFLCLMQGTLHPQRTVCNEAAVVDGISSLSLLVNPWDWLWQMCVASKQPMNRWKHE